MYVGDTSSDVLVIERKQEMATLYTIIHTALVLKRKSRFIRITDFQIIRLPMRCF